MVTLRAAIKTLDLKENDVVKLTDIHHGSVILSVRAILNRYDIKHTKVLKIESWFSCDEYKGYILHTNKGSVT